MIKCFLSHSSLDKVSYIDHVIKDIRKESRIIDSEDFEPGKMTSAEIREKILSSSLFVIFLSNSALDSTWVKDELTLATQFFSAQDMLRIYPIIIDSKITRDDARIPEWMKEKLNLRHITRPTIAARKINARLLELSMSMHVKLKEQNSIFVGRTEAIKSLEERLDDYSKPTPTTIIVSGLPSIGKKTFIKHSLKRSNVIESYFEFTTIYLTRHESIEDFILKLNDSGLVFIDNIFDRLKGSLDDKKALAIDITKQIISEKERVLIQDNGAIVQEDGSIIDWYKDVIGEVKHAQFLTYCISTTYRANRAIAFNNQAFAIFGIQELDRTERSGLLVRHLRLNNIDLANDDTAFIVNILSGYPRQILYAVELLSSLGIYETKNKSYLIQEYASDKAKVIIDTFSGNQQALELIYLLARMGFVSYKVLFDIVEEDTYFPILFELFSMSICERMGADGDYIRLNDVIRDYVVRNRFSLSEQFRANIDSHVKKYISSIGNDVEDDISNYFFSIKEGLASGESIPENLLIPSMYLKTIKSLYDDERKHGEVIKLAYKVLENEDSMHQNVVDNIRYILCQSLARTRDSRFYDEAKKMPEPSRSFLFGFFNRITGNLSSALEDFHRFSQQKPGDARVNGELIVIYLQTEEIDKAMSLAKQNYIKAPFNPINLINYAQCLFATKDIANLNELKKITEQLSKNPSERAQEMAMSINAKILFTFDNKIDDAFELIERTIETYPDVPYPLLTKADIAIQSHNIVHLQSAIDIMESKIQKTDQTYRTFIRYKAVLYSMSGRIYEAKELISKHLKGLPRNAMEKLQNKLDSYKQGGS
jgi:tetratricopeptide (TPR) repeat protein